MMDKYDEQAAALRDDLNAEIDARIAAALREAGREPHPDKDGDCSRCGLIWQEEGITDPHVCPPGFWTKQEAEIAKLKKENERLRAEMGYHEAKDVIEQLRALNETLTQQLAAKDAELAECVQSGLAVARDFTQRIHDLEARLDDSPRVQHWKRKAEHFLERAQAAERERDEARAMLHEVALSPSPICSQSHGKYCDCVGDKVTKWLAAQADKSVKPRCERCGNEIDPTTCWCGAFMENHGIGEGGHSAIPMGCDCGRAAHDKKSDLSSK